MDLKCSTTETSLRSGCTASLIENGHKNISLKMVHKISEALNINAAKLFDVNDEVSVSDWITKQVRND